MSRRAMRFLGELPDDLWMEVARGSPEATFFHTPIWRSLVTRTFPDHRDASAAVELPGGARGVLPLLEVGRRVRGRMLETLSTFGGCYGGLIAEADFTAADRQEALALILKRRRIGSLQMTGSPLAAGDLVPPRFEAEEQATRIVPLGAGWEAVRGGFSRGALGNLQRGLRAGVTAWRAGSLDEYRAYYALYEASLQRWGDRTTSRYPWSLFEAGCQLAGDHPGAIQLWLAGREGAAMAGAWVFYWNRHAVYWHGATDTAHSALRPANVLHAAIMEDACARGFQHYDFNPSGGHEGVSRFKSGFGGAVVPIRFWSYRSPAVDAIRSLRRLLP